MRTRLLIIIAFAALFAGCKKEFDLDLSADNKNYLTVEGQITDQDEPQYVKLTRTLPYLNGDAPEVIDNATVFVQFGDSTVNYTYSKDGMYLAPANFKGEVGNTYKLTILLDGKEYNANSTMYPPHFADNIHTTKCPFEDGNYDVLCDLTSNSEDDEYMMFRYKIDGVMYQTIEETSYGSNSNMGKGTFKNVEIFSIERKDEKEITVYTYTIDKPFYKFLEAASSATSEPSPISAPPGASIPGNISGDALGFFFAASVTEASGKVEY